MRTLEENVPVVIGHYVMLAGDCTLYESLGNKEHFWK